MAMLDIVRANVQHSGWHTQHDFDCQGKQHSITYTLGMVDTIGHELVVCGMDGHMAHYLYNVILKGWIPDHGPLPRDVPVDDLGNLPVLFKACDPAMVRQFMPMSYAYFGRDVPYLQMVLPDKHGRFPDSPLFDHAYMDQRQTLLYSTLH